MSTLHMLAVVCLAALLPAMTLGSVKIHIEDKDVVPNPAGGRFTLDVRFEAIDNENEMLFGYALGFVLERVGGRPGDVRFAAPYAVRPDNFVFDGLPHTFSIAPSPTPSRFVLDVLNDGRQPDIVGDAIKGARVTLEYAPGALERLPPLYSAI